MKNILFIVGVLIIFISCSFHRNKKKKFPELPKNTVSFSLNPEPFIPKLPAKLDENSGLIYWDGLLWTINDSGGENIIYGFDFSGVIQKEFEIENAENNDWEEIAQDDKYIYVGDFGNNNGNREDLEILKIKKDKLDKKSDKLKADKIKIKYADQKSYKFSMQHTEFDCEAMAEFNDHLYLFTKDWISLLST